MPQRSPLPFHQSEALLSELPSRTITIARSNGFAALVAALSYVRTVYPSTTMSMKSVKAEIARRAR